MKLLDILYTIIWCLLHDKRASFKLAGLKKVAVFGMLLFIGTWIGTWLGSYIMPFFGVLDPTISAIISFIIMILPAYWLIKRFGKKKLPVG